MSSLTAKDWLTVLSSLITSVVVALIAAHTAVRLAFKRFYLEKQWERKSDSYTKLLVALHQLKEHASHELRLAEGSDHLPKGSVAEIERQEVLNRLEADMKVGIAELRLQIDIGTFSIAPEAVDALERLMLGLDESIEIWRAEKSLQKHFVHKVKIVGECQQVLRELARRELSSGWRGFKSE